MRIRSHKSKRRRYLRLGAATHRRERVTPEHIRRSGAGVDDANATGNVARHVERHGITDVLAEENPEARADDCL